MFEEIRKQLPKILIKKSDFDYLPKYEDRKAWESLLPEQKEAYIKAGEEYLDYAYPVLPAKLYMDFIRNGNRSRYEDIYHRKVRRPLIVLFLAECAEGKGRFIDDIIDGVWTILDEATWVIPAHLQVNGNGLVEELPDTTVTEDTFIDLFSAETASLLSLIYYVLKDRLDLESKYICKRINYEIQRRIYTPFINKKDMWWMCYYRTRCNNWTPWILSNIVFAAGIECESEDTRLKVLDKSLEIIEKFVSYNTADGGCEEGPNYWNAAGAALYDFAVVIDALVGNKSGVFENQLLHDMCKFICKVHIYKKYIVNFCDSGSKMGIDSIELYRMGKSFSDQLMMDEGVAIDDDNYSQGVKAYYTLSGNFFLHRYMKNVFTLPEVRNCNKALYPYLRDSWLPGIQWMTAREQQGSYMGLYLAAVAGSNSVNHNHNDVGSYIVYRDGKPAIIDLGTGVYERKTFSENRYEILQMQSQYHNLPTIDNTGEHQGDYRASDVSYSATDELVDFRMNLATAFEEKVGIDYWNRVIRFDRIKKTITIDDSYSLKQKSDVMFTIMVLPKPVVNGNKITLNCDEQTKVDLVVDERLDIQVEEFPTANDNSLKNSWGDVVYRVLLKVKEKTDSGHYVLSIS